MFGPQFSDEELAQDWRNRSKTANVVFKIRPYFQNPWDYLRAPIAPAPSKETDRVDLTQRKT